MTNRWINVVLTIFVVTGLTAFTWHERPRAAEERARLLGQDVYEGDEYEVADAERWDPRSMMERREHVQEEPTPGEGGTEPTEVETEAPTDALAEHGVTASHPIAVEVGMSVLEAGGSAVDAAIAVSYALGVVEPFGSGIGGGGAMLIHELGEEPIGYDYREVAPLSGGIPASNIGVPGFVAGMEHIHERHGSIDLADLMEPAIALAWGGFEVEEYLQDRLRAAAHRLPIHRIPEFFPGGGGIPAGATLAQPRYAEALRTIQEQGAEAFYGGEIGAEVVEAVNGLEMDDLLAYEVLEIPPVAGHFAGFDVISGGPPVSGPTLIELLHITQELGIAGLEPGTAEHVHAVSQAYRLAMADRTEHITDPTISDMPIDRLLSREYAAQLAQLVPPDRFIPQELVEDSEIVLDSDTTHFVVVDRAGTMVSTTNTLSNFFGSGLAVSGFFLNDQLRNFSRDPESVNHVAPGKRSRSFITPTILARDGAPVLGIGSPGGRRIPLILGQVLIRVAAHSEGITSASAAPRFHLEGRDLYLEASFGGAESVLSGFGYQVTRQAPVTEFYGGIQALLVNHEDGTISGANDERRPGGWDSAAR